MAKACTLVPDHIVLIWKSKEIMIHASTKAKTRMLSSKRAFDPDKRRWHPSPLPGQIVIISTADSDGVPNIAPKSWISMVAFEGPIIAFSCNVEHLTYQNIVATHQYVINIPSDRLVETIWLLPQYHGSERLRRSGLTLAPAERVRAPIIADCVAHLECDLVRTVEFGKEVVIFGRIISASIDRSCVETPDGSKYSMLRPIFFLEQRTYGTIDGAKPVHASIDSEISR